LNRSERSLRSAVRPPMRATRTARSPPARPGTGPR